MNSVPTVLSLLLAESSSLYNGIGAGTTRFEQILAAAGTNQKQKLQIVRSFERLRLELPFRARQGNTKEIHNKMVFSDLATANPGLIAVALVIRSRDGPRFVFHYPPQPTTTQASQREMKYGTELDQSETEDKIQEDDDGDESDLEDGGYQLNVGFGKLDMSEKASSTQGKARDVDSSDGDDHYDLPSGEHFVPWEHLGEFSTQDLESILTPSRAFHKKKFELSLDPLYFVTYPIHVREDGLWKKKKPKKIKKTKGGAEVEVDGEDEKPVDSEQKVDNDNDNGEGEGKGKADDENSEDCDDHGGMTMFNVVFVLNVYREEEDERIQDIYEHVIKKFNKALKHAQAQSNYVWKESEMILSMKEKAREERKS